MRESTSLLGIVIRLCLVLFITNSTNLPSFPKQARKAGQALPSCPPSRTWGQITPSPFLTRDHILFFRDETALWRSNDEGEHWRMIYQAPVPIGRIEFFRVVPDAHTSGLHLYVLSAVSQPSPGDRTWLLRSTNQGDTWDERSTCQPNCRGIFPTDRSNTLFAALVEPPLIIFEGKGVRRSDDGGLIWQVVLGSVGVSNIVASPAFSDDHTIFATTWEWNEPPPSWLIASFDGGYTWTARDSGLGGPVGNLVFSPAFAADHTLFTFATSEIFLTRNAGTSWHLVSNLGGPSIMDMDISPNHGADLTVFVAIPFAILESNDQGANWSVLTSANQYSELTVVGEPVMAAQPPPASANRSYLPLIATSLIGGYPNLHFFLTTGPVAGNKTFYHSSDNGLNWRCVVPPAEGI